MRKTGHLDERQRTIVYFVSEQIDTDIRDRRLQGQPMAMKKLIFLDFDGVLHPNFSLEREYFSRIGYLLDALDGVAGNVEIIISSSWRFHWPEDVLLQKLPKSLAVLVTGVTPMVEPGRHQRYREIQAYLGSRAGQSDWRALDDAVNQFPDDCIELIACDGRIGIDEAVVLRLRGWLQKAWEVQSVVC